ncbi:MAG TPA: hypothetical protein VKA35_06995 [Solirubrobacterales bacterium]|nr:hypothetical protein [Solirubrobacterales bacterium]
MAALLAACGGGDSSTAPEEASGKFKVKVTEAEFPSPQRLGQTAVLRLGIRNTGDRTVPNLFVSFTIKGQRGEDSSLPFGLSDPQPELAQPDRPAWVLSATYPRLDGSSDPGGTTTSSPKTFALGALKPGKTTTAIWKLSAVRAGKFTLLYDVGAGIGGAAKAETDGGVTPGGSFTTEVTERLPETEVTDSGEIVEIEKGK